MQVLRQAWPANTGDGGHDSRVPTADGIRERGCDKDWSESAWIPAFAGMTGNTLGATSDHSREGANPWLLPQLPGGEDERRPFRKKSW